MDGYKAKVYICQYKTILIMINYIHKDISRLFKGEEEDVKTYLGFLPEIQENKVLSFFRRGLWYLCFIGENSYNVNYAIRLTPNKSILEMPLVQTNGHNRIVTIAPSMSALIPMLQLEELKAPAIAEYILEDWEVTEKMAKKFHHHFDIDYNLDYLKSYLENPENEYKLKNADVLAETTHDDIYIDFWKHYYPTKECNLLFDIIKELKETRGTYVANVDQLTGVWENRIKNLLMYFSYSNMDLETSVKELHDILWVGLRDCQPCDFTSTDLHYPPSQSISLQLIFHWPLEYFFMITDKHSAAIKSHPIYTALKELSENYGGYNGEAHVNAAKVLDEKHNDPIQAWKALVTAAYWSGVNHEDPNMPAWEAAIDLSAKHGWEDINRVLKEQLDFYNSYSG